MPSGELKIPVTARPVRWRIAVIALLARLPGRFWLHLAPSFKAYMKVNGKKVGSRTSRPTYREVPGLPRGARARCP